MSLQERHTRLARSTAGVLPTNAVSCVLLMGWSGTTVMLGFVPSLIHYASIPERQPLVFISLSIGLVLDNTLAFTGQVSWHVFIGRCPIWLAAIWAGFGQLRYSQRILVANVCSTGLSVVPSLTWRRKLERLAVNGRLIGRRPSLWGIAMYLLYRPTQPENSQSVIHPTH